MFSWDRMDLDNSVVIVQDFVNSNIMKVTKWCCTIIFCSYVLFTHHFSHSLCFLHIKQIIKVTLNNTLISIYTFSFHYILTYYKHPLSCFYNMVKLSRLLRWKMLAEKEKIWYQLTLLCEWYLLFSIIFWRFYNEK